MSITDELRKWGYGFCGDTYDVVTAIADRIDQEHEECAGFCRRLEDAASNGEEVTLFGTDYVPLPKDADGETIHLGDVMDNMHKDGFRAKRVTGICYHEGGKTTVEVDEDRLRWHNAYKLHHAQPDSWERIISEFAERVLRSGHQWGLDAPAATAEFVERCKRLAGDAE